MHGIRQRKQLLRICYTLRLDKYALHSSLDSIKNLRHADANQLKLRRTHSYPVHVPITYPFDCILIGPDSQVSCRTIRLIVAATYHFSNLLCSNGLPVFLDRFHCFYWKVEAPSYLIPF